MELSSPAVDKYNRSINRQIRVDRGTRISRSGEGRGDSGGSERPQKVSDPVLDVLLPALSSMRSFSRFRASCRSLSLK